ncbi:MAG: K(+)-transporting ATPase subunit F [Comamonas sp.]|jgi:K+-transporting ATPase KdpF subunit
MLTTHWIEALAAVTAAGLFVYLGYALLRPEKF